MDQQIALLWNQKLFLICTKNKLNQLNLIPQIVKKSSSFIWWLQSEICHSNHFVPDRGIIQIGKKSHRNEILWFSYVKFKRDDRLSRIMPPLSGPFSPLGFPLQSVCDKVFNAKLIFVVISIVKSLIIITQMTRRCWPLSRMGVDEKLQIKKES
jgi:hypothetical protein